MLFADGLHLLFDDVIGLIPAYALELTSVTAVCVSPFHGVEHAVGMVDHLRKVQTANAQLAVGARRERIALDMIQLAILGVEQHTTAVMTARRRILIGAGHGESIFLPRELALVIGLTVYAV